MKNITKLLSIFILTVSSFANSSDVDLDKLVGRYGHYDIVAYTDKLFGPFKFRNLIISYGLTDFYIEDGELISKDRFCFSEYKSNMPFKTDSPDALTRAIIPKPVALTVTRNDKGQVRIQRPETPTLLGVKLDSWMDPFPKDPDDPAYIDVDEDGNPGVTVTLSLGKVFSGQLYIARKELFKYDMIVREDGSIRGTVSDRSQQHVIGASKTFLNKESNPPQDKDPKKSPIFLIPVDQDMDCDELKAQRKDLFPKNPRASILSWIKKKH